MPTGQANGLMPTLRRVVLARQSASRSDGDLLGAFVNERDADAFAELVRRHGSMVLGVCRRLVHDHATADDAFQAAFLVLARRAASVRPREQVGNWLYGVAYRTALKARMVLARRRAREKQVDVMPEPTATPTLTADWSDLQVVIDEELAKLPDKLRLPVVLCDLEGRPQREVAKHLNVPPATLATRLASARRTLAQRLTRRGVALSGGALASLLGIHASASAVPPALASGAVRLGEAVATGTSLNTLVSANTVSLSEGVMRMMMLAKLKAVAVMAVTALMLTTGLGLGLVPATAGDEPGSGFTTATAAAQPKPGVQPSTFNKQIVAKKDSVQPETPTDDVTFLRRLCLDVYGLPPTPVETWFFVSDKDDAKREKVIEWVVNDDQAKLAIAKKLGVRADRVKIVRARLSEDGKQAVIVLDSTDAEATAREIALTFTPDGKYLVAGKDGVVFLADAAKPQPATEKLAIWFNAKQPKAVDQLIELHWATPQKEIVVADDLRGWAYLAVIDDGATGKGKYTARINDFYITIADSDAEFLKRVLTDVRGTPPTALELKYFTQDKDPKKREKLLDELLKDPAIQKKLGDAWKKKMLSLNVERMAESHLFVVPQVQGERLWLEYFNVPSTPVAPPQPSKFEKLVDELIAAKKSDEAILEALTLAVLSRLPTDSEKKLTLASIASAKDRKAAWIAVAKALGGSEAKTTELKLKGRIENPKVTPVKP